VAIFIVAGALISALLWRIVSGMAARNVSVPDRIAGAALGPSALRSHGSTRSRAGFPEGLAGAGVGRAIRNTGASTGSRRLCRSPEASTAPVTVKPFDPSRTRRPPIGSAKGPNGRHAATRPGLLRLHRHVSASNAGFHGLRPEAVTFASGVHKWLAQWAEIAIRYPSTFRVPEGFRWRK
jgi:hypothetical protein